MAYTKYSLTPANNTAAPPDGAPEGMLPSAVNDTMRDMMAQIRDVGDGVRDGTYTMTAPKITGGTITGAAITSSTGSFTTLATSSTTTFTGLTASTALALDASKNVVSVTNTGTGSNVLSASPTLTGTIAGASLSLSSLTSGRVVYAGASGLLSDSTNLFWDATNSRLGIGTASPSLKLSVSGGLATTGIISSLINTGSGLNAKIHFTDATTYNWTCGTTGDAFTVSTGEFGTTAGTELIRINSTGLGIGTASPTAKLDVNGNIVMTGVAWTAYTPTITASTGSFTTVSATGKYYIFGKTCTLNMIVDITTAGTATGVMYATLPFTSAARIQIGGYGMEVNATGSMLKGYIPSSTTQLQVTTYANATTIGTGFSNILTVVYEIA